MMSKRPSNVTSLLLLVLTLTVWNAIRLGTSIADWDVLLEFAPRPGPWYIALSAAFWALSGAALYIALQRQNPRASAFTAAFALGYAAWWWIDRLFLQEPRTNGTFAAFVTVFLLTYSAILLYHPRTKEYLRQRERHEQTTPHPNTT